jgi:hypothetical protein
MSRHRATGHARLWAGGISTAAAAAAMIGMGTAHADDGSVPTDIGLLNTAQTDIAEAFSLSGHTNADAGFFPELEAIQTPLLSSDNSFVSGFGEVLFNGPDQQLAQASEAFLSAAETLSSDTTNLTALGDYASTGFQVTGAIFGEIPSTLIGKLTDQIFDIGGFDTTSASAATDLAASASSAAVTPDDVIGQAITDLNQGNVVLDAASTADLSARQADALAEQLSLSTQTDPILLQLESLQDSMPAGAQNFLGSVDEQLITAAQNVVSADQAFVAADQAGDLSSNSFLPIDLTNLEADLGLGGALLNADFQSFFALFDPNIGADSAASAATTFAELLSSIGL